MRTALQPASTLQPEAEFDLLDVAKTIAIACAGESFGFFCRNYFGTLAQMPPAALMALAAEFFARGSPDQSRFVFVYAHETQQPSEQRRTPEQLLEHMRANGFQPPSTRAMRRAEAAYLHELEQPPLSPDAERAARLAYVREQVQLLLTASVSPDFVRPEHRQLLEAMPANDVDLDEELLRELSEICTFYYQSLKARARTLQDMSATPRSTLH